MLDRPCDFFLECFFFPSFLTSLRAKASASLDCIHIGILVAQNAKGYTVIRE